MESTAENSGFWMRLVYWSAQIRADDLRTKNWALSVRPRSLDRSFLELHVQCQPTNLVGQHVKAGRCAGLQRVLSFDH
jgi:hypothetical protein